MKPILITITSAFIGLIALSGGCVGSGSTAGTSAPPSPFAPTSPSNVTISQGGAPQGTVVIGDVWASTNDFSGMSEERLNGLLRQKAASLGADMVVNVKYDFNLLLNIGEAQGVAIKFVESSSLITCDGLYIAQLCEN